MRGREVASRALGGRARREAAGQAGGVTPTALASRCITCPFARRLTPPSWLMLRHSDVPNFQIFSSPGPTRWRVDAHWIALDFLSFLRCPLPLEPKRGENLHLVVTSNKPRHTLLENDRKAGAAAEQHATSVDRAVRHHSRPPSRRTATPHTLLDEQGA